MPAFTCKGCPDRKLACHGSCEKYQHEKAVFDQKKASRKLLHDEYSKYRSRSMAKNMDISAKRRHGMGWRYG